MRSVKNRPKVVDRNASWTHQVQSSNIRVCNIYNINNFYFSNLLYVSGDEIQDRFPHQFFEQAFHFI